MDKQLVEALKPHRDLKNASMSSKTGKLPNSDKGPNKSASGAPSGGVRTMSDETLAVLPQAIKEVFKTRKVCRYVIGALTVDVTVAEKLYSFLFTSVNFNPVPMGIFSLQSRSSHVILS